ncbi:MAG: hypothetical protein QM817_40325 [Archangium sp.]
MSRSLRSSLFLAFLTLPLLAAKGNACQAEDSSNVNQSRIYTGYWLAFDANANTTSARAQFRLSHSLGTTLELKDPAKVTFGGKAMAYNPLLQWHEVQQTGALDGGSFVYVDTEGTSFSNEAKVTLVTELPAMLPEKLKRSEGFTLSWVGAPLTKGEDMELVVRGADSADFIRVDQFDTGATSITVPANQLARVGGTNAVLTLKRHTFVDDPFAPDAGGQIHLEYDAKSKTVPLE